MSEWEKHEYLQYDHALTKKDRRKVERYLRRKWLTRRERVMRWFRPTP